MQKEKIQIYQGFFGESGPAHGCLKIGFDKEDSFNISLLGFTDRPGKLPPGTILQPYISGTLLEGKYYVFSKTFPDTDANRPGMVFTHALMISPENVAKLNNLRLLYDFFPSSLPDNKANLIVDTIELEFSPENEPLLDYEQNGYPTYLFKTVERVLSGKSQVIPFCGDLSQFMEVVTVIWRGLFGSLRQRFKFQAGFIPDDVEEEDDSIFLVYVQPSLKGQWLYDPRNIIDAQSPEMNIFIQELPPAEEWFFKVEKTSLLKDFAIELGADIASSTDYSDCYEVYTQYTRLPELDVSKVRILLEKIQKLSPDGSKGMILKEEIIHRMSALVEEGKYPSIQGFRNKEFSGIKNGQNIISQAIAAYIHKIFTGELLPQPDQFIKWLRFAQMQQGQEWWRTIVMESVNSATENMKTVEAEVIWRFSLKGSLSEDDIGFLWRNFIPPASAQENALVASFPEKNSQVIADIIPDICKERSWGLLHAFCLQVKMKPEEYFMRQLEMENNLSLINSRGLQHLSDQSSHEELLALATSVESVKLHQLAGKRIANNPELLSDLDVEDDNWLSIWAFALELNQSIEVENLDQKSEKLLDKLVLEDNIPEIILRYLADSPFSNLCHRSDRSQILSKLPYNIKKSFIERTAEQLIDNLTQGSTDLIIGSIEKEITRYIFNWNMVEKKLANHKNNINILKTW